MIRPPGLAESLLHAVLWQGMWTWLVWAGGRDAWLWPLLAAAALLAAALWRAGAARWRLLAVMATAVACGVAVDGSLGRAGLVAYGAAAPGPLPPPWILALWALFAAAVALPLRRVLGHPVIAALAGLVGGPLAYWAGQALGAIAFPRGAQLGLVGVGAAFALATPVIVLVLNRLLPLPPSEPRRRRTART